MPERAGTVRKRPRRAFYSIGEVCAMFDLKPHVLRYWETQFEELHPTKNRAGNRVYEAKEVDLIALIKRLVHDERYTIEGARHRLGELERDGRVKQSRPTLERSVVRSLRAELEEILRLLDAGSVDRARGRARSG